MLGYYKNHVLRLSARLQELHAEPDNLQLLLSLQRDILRRILHTEARISEYRERWLTLGAQIKDGRLPKQDAARLKRKLSAADATLKQYQWLLYVWRCFGDGIAFAYVNKWAMKPLLYNVQNAYAKQGPGNITGKEGLKGEIALLLEAIRSGVPALLTDLTNSIRHGDVCLLSGPDPHLIEVKSSKNSNRRVSRQIENLSSIHSYLEKDEAFNVRGFPHIKRVELAISERSYLDRLDAAISAAITDGLYVADFEPGSRLVVIGGAQKPNYDRIFADLKRPRIYMLNDAKNGEAWGCYYPFTLSLKTPQNLYAFLHGDVYVIVVLDLALIESRASELGLKFSETGDRDWVYQLERLFPGSKEPMIEKISSHFADRMAFELLSWEWLLEVEGLRLEQLQLEGWPTFPREE